MPRLRAGLGISIVPEMALEKRPDRSSALIADERASRTIGVAALKGHFLSRVPLAFLEHLRSQAQGRSVIA
jgi:DNA-binding transcriptional LysR family regulator